MKTKTSRVANDVYETPPALAASIVQMLVDRQLVGTPKLILEPSAGSGVFVRAAREAWPDAEIMAVELRAECEAALAEVAEVAIAPFEQIDFTDTPPVDLVLGNPPYSLTSEHLTHLAEISGPNTRVAFLLRLSFLASQERADTIWANDFKLQLEYLIPIVPRPSFVGGGNDMSEYALFVWRNRAGHQAECLEQKRSTTARLLSLLRWDKERRKRGPATGPRKPKQPKQLPGSAQVQGVTPVVNLNFEEFDVYIGRAGNGFDGYFGNPFPLESEDRRETVLNAYRNWFLQRLEVDLEFKQRVLALRGKRLGCFCAPKLCHGHVIAAWIDSHSELERRSEAGR